MATYSYVCASENYVDGSADSNHNNNYLATTGSTLRLVTQRTITNSTDNGLVGEICVDSSYIYVCVASNTWKRSSLFTY